MLGCIEKNKMFANGCVYAYRVYLAYIVGILTCK